MVELVNSKQRELTIPEVLVIAAEHQNISSYPTQTALALLLKEIQLTGKPPVLIGNTVFIENFAKRGGKKIVIWRPLNADTPRNMAANCAEYIVRRIREGYDILVTEYNNNVYDPIVKLVARLLDSEDIGIAKQQSESGTRVLFLNPSLVD